MQTALHTLSALSALAALGMLIAAAYNLAHLIRHRGADRATATTPALPLFGAAAYAAIAVFFSIAAPMAGQ